MEIVNCVGDAAAGVGQGTNETRLINKLPGTQKIDNLTNKEQNAQQEYLKQLDQ